MTTSFDPKTLLDGVDVPAKFEELSGILEEFLSKVPDNRLDVSMQICASLLFNSILYEFERNGEQPTPDALGSSCASATQAFRSAMISGMYKFYVGGK